MREHYRETKVKEVISKVLFDEIKIVLKRRRQIVNFEKPTWLFDFHPLQAMWKNY